MSRFSGKSAVSYTQLLINTFEKSSFTFDEMWIGLCLSLFLFICFPFVVFSMSTVSMKEKIKDKRIYLDVKSIRGCYYG